MHFTSRNVSITKNCVFVISSYVFKCLPWIYNNSDIMCLIHYCSYYMHFEFFISEISHLKVTHITCMHYYKLNLAEDDTATYLRCLKIQFL